jgi:hypothetical protein
MPIAVHQFGSAYDHANPSRIFVCTLWKEDDVPLLSRGRLGKCLQFVPSLPGLSRGNPADRKRKENQNSNGVFRCASHPK